jgi:hypothetical protein
VEISQGDIRSLRRHKYPTVNQQPQQWRHESQENNALPIQTIATE